MAGAICGLIGASLQAVLDLARIGAALRIASGVLLDVDRPARYCL